MRYNSSWLTSLTPLADWRAADWLKNGCRGCFVGACGRVWRLHHVLLALHFVEEVTNLEGRPKLEAQVPHHEVAVQKKQRLPINFLQQNLKDYYHQAKENT